MEKVDAKMDLSKDRTLEEEDMYRQMLLGDSTGDIAIRIITFGILCRVIAFRIVL